MYVCVYAYSSYTLSAETFWRRLQEIIPCKTVQRRSLAKSSHSVQMVQFPSLEQCKQAFRAHMADAQWVFHCDSANAVTKLGQTDGVNRESTDMQSVEPTAQEMAQKRFDEVVKRIRSGAYTGSYFRPVVDSRQAK